MVTHAEVGNTFRCSAKRITWLTFNASLKDLFTNRAHSHSMLRVCRCRTHSRRNRKYVCGTLRTFVCLVSLITP